MRITGWKRIAVAIAAALLGFIGLGSWAVASPVGSSPDDDYHMVSIWCAWGEREGLCEPGNAENERSIPNELYLRGDCYVTDEYETDTCETRREMVSTPRGDFANNYPPVYYKTMAVFAGENIDASVAAIRLANAAVFVALISTLLALLPRGKRGPLFWTSVVGLVPLGMFIVPSVNPSSWAILAGLTVWVSLTAYMTEAQKGRRIGLGIYSLLVTVMGAGARGDAGTYMIIAAGIAAILTFQPAKQWLKRMILPIVIMLIGAAFFLTTGQSTSYASTAVSQAASSQAAANVPGAEVAAQSWPLIVENLMEIPSLWAGSLGTWELGWFEWELPQTIPVIMVGAFSALIFMGLRVIDWRKGLALALLLLALVLIPSYILYGIQTKVGTEVQPRYLLPLILISAGVALYGFRRDDLGLTTIQSLVLIVGVSYANSLALFKTMRRYLTGTDYPGLNLNSNIDWWWAGANPNFLVSPMLIWFVGSLAFGLALLGGYLLLRGQYSNPLESNFAKGEAPIDQQSEIASSIAQPLADARATGARAVE